MICRSSVFLFPTREYLVYLCVYLCVPVEVVTALDKLYIKKYLHVREVLLHDTLHVIRKHPRQRTFEDGVRLSQVVHRRPLPDKHFKYSHTQRRVEHLAVIDRL